MREFAECLDDLLEMRDDDVDAFVEECSVPQLKVRPPSSSQKLCSRNVRHATAALRRRVRRASRAVEPFGPPPPLLTTRDSTARRDVSLRPVRVGIRARDRSSPAASRE